MDFEIPVFLLHVWVLYVVRRSWVNLGATDWTY